MHSAQMGNSFKVQKKGTPFKKPRKSGGSPIGLSRPPILLTIKMKKTVIWAVFFLWEFVCNSGRINSILAPVVPIMLARTAPVNKNKVLLRGVAFKSPLKLIPPVVMKSEESSVTNERYSTPE